MAPSWSVFEIIPEEGITTSTQLVCLLNAVDENNDSVELTMNWTNSANDTLGTDPVLQLSPEMVSPGEVLTCTATITDNKSDVLSQSAEVTVNNTAPVLDIIEISPASSIFSDTVLNCSATAFDADLETAVISYSWTADGTELGTDSELVLTPETVDRDDEITCTVTATDAFGGTDSDSASVTVENSLPVIDSAEMTPSPAYSQESINCSVNSFTDMDGDDVVFSYSWTMDGVLIEDADSDVLVGPFTVGGVVECSVGINDGLEDGTGISLSTVIENTAPLVESVDITPDSDVKADTLLSCNGSANDLDGGTPILSYSWTNVNGDVLGVSSTLQLDPSVTPVGDSITCMLTATDINGGSNSDFVSVTVNNTAPTVLTAANVQSVLITTGSLLSCSASFEDINEGTLPDGNVTFFWSDTAGAVLSMNSEYTIDADETEPGDVLTCTATGTDSEGSSVISTADVTIENTVPTTPSVSILESTPYVGVDDLNCSIDVPSTDLDLQTITYSYEWLDSISNSIQITGPTTSLTDTLSASLTSEGLWTCTVTANDGMNDGSSVSASVTLDYSVNMLTAGDLVITEVMNNPASVDDANGEWIELYNNTAVDINIQGLTFLDLVNEHIVSDTVWIAAGDYAVLGNNADLTTNGDIQVDYEFSTIQINNANETLTISNSIGEIDSVSWSDEDGMPHTAGASMSLSSDFISSEYNDDSGYWCEALTMMSTDDYGTPGFANEDCDDDDDGLLAGMECDDFNSSETILIADDGDCDGSLTVDDCDDADATSTIVADDGDCDTVLTADDCDDLDENSTIVADDGDCDGFLTSDDCDDLDENSTIVADDGDCDGFLTVDDCDDLDENSTIVADDGDCDGVLTVDDCDDTNAFSTIIADDADCDGVLTLDDCDDTDDTDALFSGDCDQDGVTTADDCDDTDDTDALFSGDCDQDGVLTADDCDDTDDADALFSGDCDEDGVLTADDCDDTDDTDALFSGDCDQDGVLTADDCDDTDGADALFSGDCDQDGVLTLDDCDDADATSTIVAADYDCDGLLTADDCDDTDDTDALFSGDCDQDGFLSADDCNDNNPMETVATYQRHEITDLYDSDYYRATIYDTTGTEVCSINTYSGWGSIPQTESSCSILDADEDYLFYYSESNMWGPIEEQRGSYTHIYDSSDRIIERSVDENDDGSADYIDYWSYDAAGNILSRSYDNNGDGFINDDRSYTYDIDGNMLSSAYDWNGDGNYNNMRYFTYDTNGNRLTSQYDRYADGVIDSSESSVYDIDGNRTNYTIDSNNDGNPSYIRNWTYDSNGNILTEVTDDDGDGFIDLAIEDEIRTYTYDSNGYVASYLEEGTNCNLTSYINDADGNELKRYIDNYCTGTLDQIRTFTYDIYGNMLSRSYDDNADGVDESIVSSTYNIDNNLLTYGWESNGIIISRTEYDYNSEGELLNVIRYEYGVVTSELIHTDIEELMCENELPYWLPNGPYYHSGFRWEN